MKHNPFSTRKTAPGQIPFIFDKDCDFLSKNDIEFCALYNLLAKSEYRSQILGAHGTGKSTFLAGFVPILEDHGHRVHWVSLHDRQRRLPQEFWQRQQELAGSFAEKPPIVIVDGYEQLSWMETWKLSRWVRKTGSGLLITSHGRIRHFPVLFRTKADPDVLRCVIELLFRDQSGVEPPDWPLCLSLFECHQGNLRNVMFDLYDHYETT